MKQHVDIVLPVLERIETGNKRMYLTPSGKQYPSITSVTGIRSQPFIDEWKARVGIEEANKITTRAANRGTKIHALCENHLNNEKTNVDVFHKEMWDNFVPALEPIDKIYCLERMLFSDKLQVAGTVDCIAEYNGILSVIDFKTSSKVKHRQDISGYFMQCCMYALSLYEMTGIQAKQIVILMAVEDEKPLVFIERVLDWIKESIIIRDEFLKLKGY